jgi:hypothetical protein
MTNHTSEPWAFDESNLSAVGGGRIMLIGISTPMTAGSALDEARANARRIVACVNALAGIDTDELERIAAERDDLRLNELAGIALRVLRGEG